MIRKVRDFILFVPPIWVVYELTKERPAYVGEGWAGPAVLLWWWVEAITIIYVVRWLW